jgi:hypothetical protein
MSAPNDAMTTAHECGRGGDKHQSICACLQADGFGHGAGPDPLDP